MNTTTVSKVGENRGRTRVWLEGSRLLASGFNHKTAYSVTYHAGRVDLSTTEAAEGVRYVAGSPERPVIDLCAAKVGAALGKCERVAITWAAGRISIQPEGKR